MCRKNVVYGSFNSLEKNQKYFSFHQKYEIFTRKLLRVRFRFCEIYWKFWGNAWNFWIWIESSVLTANHFSVFAKIPIIELQFSIKSNSVKNWQNFPQKAKFQAAGNEPFLIRLRDWKVFSKLNKKIKLFFIVCIYS